MWGAGRDVESVKGSVVRRGSSLQQETFLEAF